MVLLSPVRLPIDAYVNALAQAFADFDVQLGYDSRY
jgi:hypothetical protein